MGYGENLSLCNVQSAAKYCIFYQKGGDYMNNTEKSIESMNEEIRQFMEMIIYRNCLDGKLISEVCGYDIEICMKQKSNIQ